MHLVAETPLRPNGEAVANDQHPDHQLRVDRGPPRRAVVRRQQAPDARQIDEAIDPPQQMIRRYVILDRELVEQRALRHLPRTHHRQPFRLSTRTESAPDDFFNAEFFNGISALLSCGFRRRPAETCMERSFANGGVIRRNLLPHHDSRCRHGRRTPGPQDLSVD